MKFSYLNKMLPLLLLAGATSAFAQTNSEYRTLGNGLWDATGVWERWKQNPNMAWLAVNPGPGWNTPRTSVLSGFTVYLGPRQTGGAVYTEIDNSIIYDGGALQSNANIDDTVRFLRIWGRPDTAICVNGTLGGNGKAGWIVLESMSGTKNATSCSICPQTTHLLGTGTIKVSGFRFSAVSSGFTDSFYIDNNMSITGINNNGYAYGLTTYNNSSSNTISDKHFLYISAGKTVTMTDSSWFHMRSNTTANKAGNMTYYINGTLDMSTSSGFTNLIASPTSTASVTTVNVKGLFKMGKYFNTLSATVDSGSLVLNINDSGVVNATAVATPNANFGAKQWFTIGTGVFKRYVGATDTIFAVTTSAATNNSVLLNTTTADTFSVSVGAANYAWVAGNVQKEWKVKKTATGNAAVKASFMWTTADQSGGFNPTTASVMVYTGAQWKEYAATVTGAGTLASPYKAATNTAIDSIRFAYVTATGAGVPNPVGIKSVKTNNGSVVVSPNPVVNGAFGLQLKSANTGKYAVTLYNIMGQKVYSTELNHVSGMDVHAINISSVLISGIYQLSVSGEGFNSVQKLLIK